MSEKTWMPLYIGDYLADTQHLSAEEHGAYLLLIMFYWRNGGAIKNDKNLIKNVAKISQKKLKNILAFFEEKDGVLFHKRIDKELIESRQASEKYTERAKTAAAKRWNKHYLQNATSNANSIAKTMLEECPSPSPIVVTSNTNLQRSNAAREDSEKINDLKIHPDFEKVFRCIEKFAPQLMVKNTGLIHAWLEAGHSAELDINPTIERICSKPPPTGIHSLKFFDAAIADAKAARTQKPTEAKPKTGVQQNANNHHRDNRYDNRDPAKRAFDEAELIIAERKARWDAEDAAAAAAAAQIGQAGPDTADAVALPDLREPESVW